MTRFAEETEAVAPLIRYKIKVYEDCLNIVERPSVGSLTAPVKTCTLIHNVLGFALYSFTQRGSAKIWVRCGRATPSKLVLEVMADRAWPPSNEIRASFRLSELNQEASLLDGEIITGGERIGDGMPSFDVFFRLIVPIPS